MAQRKRSWAVRRVSFMGMLFAVALVLGYLESLVTVPGLPPGIKLGLSNIVTMYCLFYLGWKDAYLLAALKAFSALFLRGPVGAALSLMGGVLSVSVMLLILRCFKRFSYLTVSVFGAVFHNLGQLAVASLITGTPLTLYYFPVLILSGVGMGVVTGLVLRVVLPVMQRIYGRINSP